ncbi:hypothetical protein D3Z33_05555 [Senegalia massiliensis]|uniref:Uncharacterized protein n=2 Tax=Senegalia massiliensis TaxID=1720316 RepID=A0A845QUX8_9CLOT|nr:hypothetical protein [Senegalia massiliensis]
MGNGDSLDILLKERLLINIKIISHILEGIMSYSKKVCILFICIITSFTIGCSIQNEEQSLIKSTYFEDVDKIIIYKGSAYKQVQDLKSFKKVLKDIEGKKVNIENLSRDETEDRYKIIFTYESSDQERKISFKGNNMLYDDNWYSIDKNIDEIYNKIDFEEKIDSNLQKSKVKREARKNFKMKDSLLGNWIYDDETYIEFTKKHIIYKTKQKDRKFNYKINRIDDNKIFITAYRDILFSNDKDIFKIEILIDDTKNNIILKKKMLKSEMGYKNNLIYIDYIDDKKVELGSFDDLFFVENKDI